VTGASTQVERAAAWGAAFQLRDAPADVVDLSRLQVGNILAAVLAGSRSRAGMLARAAQRRALAPGPCTLLPHGEKATLWDALWLHAVYANALELDDFHYRGHLGPAAVLVPLVLGEALGRDGAAALRAQIVANELAGRLGFGVTAEIRHGHQRSYLLRFAAAAGASSLLGLDAGRFATALAIAMTQPELPLHPGMFSPDTKVLSAASSVVEGVRAAHLAAEGFGAARDVLEHPAGFYRQFTMHRSPPDPFVQMGAAWCTHALCFKRYSACAYASGAVDAALEVRRMPGFEAGAVAAIAIASGLPALTMERLAEPHERGVLTPVNVQFSIRRCVAAALALGDLRGFHFAADRFDDMLPEVRRLSAVATLGHDWRLTVEQLRGLDDGLSGGGGRHSADMLQFHRTMRAFRAMFGSARALGPADVPRLLALPPEDRRYFAGRWGRSLVSRLARRRRSSPAEGPLGDLRRLSFRMGARVSVRLRDGRVLTAERVQPTGMAGDPGRAQVVEEKLRVEAEPVLGLPAAERLWTAIARLPEIDVAELHRAASRRQEVDRVAAADRRSLRPQGGPT
jgi:2-methylcitrate dehydratase PrpD